MTLAHTGSVPRVVDPENTESIEYLVRKLIHKVQESDPAAGTHVSSSFLDVEVDGFHYTLLRSQCTETCHLSPREKEIVRLVAEGLPNKCIGAVLEISSWTVATHLQRIFSKLGVTSRAAMVARSFDPPGARQSDRSQAGNRIVAGQPKINTREQGRRRESDGKIHASLASSSFTSAARPPGAIPADSESSPGGPGCG